MVGNQFSIVKGNFGHINSQQIIARIERERLEESWNDWESTTST